jgi:hypothetical protein
LWYPQTGSTSQRQTHFKLVQLGGLLDLEEYLVTICERADGVDVSTSAYADGKTTSEQN